MISNSSSCTTTTTVIIPTTTTISRIIKVMIIISSCYELSLLFLLPLLYEISVCIRIIVGERIQK